MQPERSLATALGRVAGLLVLRVPRIRLNVIRETLEDLAREPYDPGYDDAVRALDDRANEAADREHRGRLQEFELGP